MKSHCSLNTLLVAGYLLYPCSARADCDLSTYERTLPRPIRSVLDNGTAHFEWSTDVDTIDGRNWIWHYIKNLDAQGIGYRWPKANLRRALGSPLQPGKTDCNRYFVISPFDPDANAPITYGTGEAVQRAAVYAESAAPMPGHSTDPAGTGTPAAPAAAPIAPATGSVVETSYTAGAGTVENVRVAISTSEGNSAEDRWKLRIEKTSNVIVGISSLPKIPRSAAI